MFHYCNVIVVSLWHHLERRAVGGATKIIKMWSGGHELLNYGES